MPSHPSNDTFKILIASDNHLGYAENDPLRGNDSFVTFEEILSQAQVLQVDFILLGGDLFHENKPSRDTVHNCLQLLRKYCLGNSPVQFQFLSDQTENFKHSSNPTVNYEDPNINVSIPVFSIHGNHDNPTGINQVCALDLISDAGLINHFGKCPDLQDVTLSPLLMSKGCTKIAMYGMGSIRDERLHRMFLSKTVKMLRPTEDANDWFNIFVFHQNRVRHGETNYIPDNFLPDFLDLVVWGHEHECRIDPEQTSNKYFISQPGSSVATSICPAEAVPKHIGLLEIYRREMRITKIPLETVRQFYLEDIVLSETSINFDGVHDQRKVMNYCKAKVDELLEKAHLNRSGNEKQPELPLIQLRVYHDDINHTISKYQFAQNFLEAVANPKDIIKFHRATKRGDKKESDEVDGFEGIGMEMIDIGRFSAVDLVKEYFEGLNDTRKQMTLLTEKALGRAVMEFVDKEEKDAISALVSYQLEKTQKYLMQLNVSEDSLEEDIRKYRTRRQNTQEEDVELQEVMKETRSKSFQKGSIIESENEVSEMEASDNSGDESSKTNTRGRGRGRARGQRRGRSTSTRSRGGRGRGASPRNALIQPLIDQAAATWKTRSRDSTQKSRGRRSMVESDGNSSDDMFSSSTTKRSRTYSCDSDEGPF